MSNDKIFFDAATISFYHSAFQQNIPETAKEISKELFDSLFQGQASGSKVISVDQEGNPCLTDKIIDPEIAKKRAIEKEILRLEKEVTPRRLREAALGIDNNWLADQDNKIAELRQQLS